jgi:hypothetical protein
MTRGMRKGNTKTTLDKILKKQPLAIITSTTIGPTEKQWTRVLIHICPYQYRYKHHTLTILIITPIIPYHLRYPPTYLSAQPSFPCLVELAELPQPGLHVSAAI